MSLIKTVARYPARGVRTGRVLLLCGFGGSIWQTRRLTRVLRSNGYEVTAVDFHRRVLTAGDPQLLPQLTDEVVDFAEGEARRHEEPILLIGISLGALMSLNILRRSELFHEAVMITGGDIVKVAQRIRGGRIWRHTYEEIAPPWQDVNMYTPPEHLAGKRFVFVLPTRDKLIDPDDVRREIAAQRAAGNDMTLIERDRWGHVGTIISETIVSPRRILGYIESLRSSDHHFTR